MSEITLSAGVRSNLNTLQTTANLLSQTQERLATGNRVNSALDDPTAFFTAQALNDRAADLSTLLDDQGQAVQTVQAADDGLTAITQLVEQARATANQALQTSDTAERANLATTFDGILTQIESIAQDASFNGTNLLAGQNLQVVFNEDGTSSLDVTGFDFTDASAANGLNLQNVSTNGSGTPGTTTAIAIADLDATANLTIDADGALTGSSPFNIDLSGLATGATPATPGTTSTSSFNVTNVTNGDNFVLEGVDGSGNNQTLTITFGTDTAGGEIDATTITDRDAFINAVNTAADAVFGAGNVVASAGTGTEVNFSSTTGQVGGGTSAFNDANNGGVANNATIAASTDFVAGSAGTLAQTDVINAINAQTSTTGVTAIADGSTGFTLSSTQGNVTAADGGSVNVTGTGFVAGTGSDFATNTDIQNTLSAIDSALGTLRTSASTLGTSISTIQVRQDFTSNLINTLEVGAGNLTLADLNEEGANLLTLQTRQALASTSLAFATQADQAVLALF